jgi:hypothetical protein
MKKFFRFAAIAVAAIALFSCEKPPQGDDTQTPGGNEKPEQTVPEYTEDLTFTLAVTEVEADKAKIKVEHNGTTKDTWIGFETTETDIEKAIADFIAEGNVTLKKNTSTTMTVRGLEPETKYTFVAVGVKADGSVYGNHAIIEFTTAKAEEPTPPTPPAPEGYTVNPNWTVTYIGDYEEGGKVYDNVVVVETTDTNPYFVTAWPVDYYEELGIEAIVDAEIETWNEMLAEYPGATWADIVYAESILSQVGIDPEYGTKWYAMAIGCDTNGKATGLYALSEVIDLENLGGGEEEEPTAEYAAWLGDWTFTGANGVAWPITFSKGKANQSFIMTGWEGFGDLGVVVEWDATNQIWAAMIQNLGTFEFQGGKTGDIWFAAYDAEGYFYPVDGIPAFLGGYDEEGNRVAVGYAPQDNSGNTIDFVMAGYVIDFGADQYGVLSDPTTLPTFPITITPATKATTYAVKEFKGGKKTLNPLAPKTFKTFSLCDMSVRTF